MKYWPLLVPLVLLLQEAHAFERTEQRQPCADYQLDKKPLPTAGAQEQAY